MGNSDQKDLLLIETLVKLAALHKILVRKGLLTDQEMHDEMKTISQDLVAQMKVVAPISFDDTSKN